MHRLQTPQKPCLAGCATMAGVWLPLELGLVIADTYNLVVADYDEECRGFSVSTVKGPLHGLPCRCQEGILPDMGQRFTVSLAPVH